MAKQNPEISSQIIYQKLK